MSDISMASRFRAPFTYASNRAKDALRPFLPSHRRFLRSGESFFREGEREVHELPRLIRPDTVAIDVGAHLGTYCYAMCKLIGPAGRIIAIEPIPDLAKMIDRASRRLKLPIEVLNCGLSSTAGSADLLIPVKMGARHVGYATLEPRSVSGTHVKIDLRRLDDICAAVDKPISFIKIDVEGHELQVLRGATATLERHRPNLLIEIEQRHSSAPIEETFNFLTSMSYQGEFLDPHGKRLPLAQFDKSVHQVPSEESIATPKYVSNFIFQAG